MSVVAGTETGRRADATRLGAVVHAVGIRPVEWLVAAGMLAMTAVVFVSVFFRYVLNDSLPWAEELSRFIFVYIAFLGAALAVERGSHLVVDVARELVPPAVQRLIRFLSDVLVATVLCFLVVEGGKLTSNSGWLKSTALSWPMSVFTFTVPLGTGLMLVYMASRGARQERSARLSAVGLGVGIYLALATTRAAFPPGAYQLALLGIVFVVQVGGGVPVAFSMLSSSLLFMILKGDIPLQVSAQVLAGGMDSFPLLAIPFFIL
ncbi:MAG TPA: TRAP transporter small permease subunit, partial [Methylomirabilota bacterium]|nr:TRAP transporter small permease subunit [Methylomirabilota bacterium]